MKQEIYRLEVEQALSDQTSENGHQLVELFAQIEDLIFMGKKDPQPLKWHQVKRMYKLAESCVKIVLLLIPYLRVIIKWVK